MIGTSVRAFTSDGEMITGIVIKEYEKTYLAFMVDESGCMSFMEVPKDGENVIKRVIDLD